MPAAPQGRFLSNRVFDTLLTLKPSGTLTASSSLQATGGAAGTILDVGAGFVEGQVIINVSALNVGAGLGYEIFVTGAETDSTLATDTNIEELCQSTMIGDQAARRTDANKVDDAIGIYIMPFRNERNGRVFRYLRVFTVVTGAGSITYSAQLGYQSGQ